jgi:hypothetical protein
MTADKLSIHNAPARQHSYTVKQNRSEQNSIASARCLQQSMLTCVWHAHVLIEVGVPHYRANTRCAAASSKHSTTPTRPSCASGAALHACACQPAYRTAHACRALCPPASSKSCFTPRA